MGDLTFKNENLILSHVVPVIFETYTQAQTIDVKSYEKKQQQQKT